MSQPRFELLCESEGLRRGRYHTAHGSFETPCFAPVGTYGTVKGLTPAQLRETGAELVLANAYHLAERPGAARVRELGGLHRFMAWEGPILTDSGGYQVFSLDAHSEVDDGGVTFRSVLDGSSQRLTPESALEIQRSLGGDIAMVLDQCPAATAGVAEVAAAHVRTLVWAERSRELHESWGGAGRGQALFGIVQGGVDPELRAESARRLVELDFDGYAVGGLSVGETREQMDQALAAAVPELPREKLRYLMGVGLPADFQRACRAGIDLFDCVTPTRHGRNHQAFTRQGTLKLRNQQHAGEAGPLDLACSCYCCRNFSRGYLRHLSVAKEILAGTLLSIHNLQYFQDLMAEIRRAAEDENQA